jgi:hypothetical protein
VAHPLENLDAPGLTVGLVVGNSRRLLNAVKKQQNFMKLVGKFSVAERLFFEYSGLFGM